MKSALSFINFGRCYNKEYLDEIDKNKNQIEINNDQNLHSKRDREQTSLQSEQSKLIKK